jgi:hypothetical protein
MSWNAGINQLEILMKKTLLLALGAAALMTPMKDAYAISEAAVLWLLISPGSRPAGMGEAFVALADDATASWWNPAGLAFQQSNDVRFMHSDWLPAFKLDDIYFDFLAGSMYLPSLGGTLAASLIYMNEGDQTHTSETGEILGVITSREYALGVSYGTPINPDLAIGLGAKVIISDLASGTVGQQEVGTGLSFGVDFGALWRTSIPWTAVPMNLGMNLANFGPEISYVDEKQADPLPTNLKMGLAINAYSDPHSELNFVFDINKQLVRKSMVDRERAMIAVDDVDVPAYWDETGNLTEDQYRNDGSENEQAFWGIYDADPVYEAIFSSWFPKGMSDEFDNYVYNFGFEYWYRSQAGGLGDAAFALRAGYLNDPAGKIESYTTGMTVEINMFAFDFSYEMSADKNNPSPRDKTMRYSLGMTF